MGTIALKFAAGAVAVILLGMTLAYGLDLWDGPDGEERSEDWKDGSGATDAPEGEEPAYAPGPDPEPIPGPSPEPEPTPEPAPPAEARSWTGLFYVAYDNSIGTFNMWGSDLIALESVGPPENGTLIALVDLLEDGDSRLVKIYKGGHEEYPVSLIDDSWGDELNTGAPETLYKFLAWGMETYPADHYAVSLLDHGGAWSGACIDETNGNDLILGHELREVFDAVAGHMGRGVDLLLMDMCFMANLEFAYEVCDSVDYLIAEQNLATAMEADEDYYVGNFLYDEIWRGLAENPNWTPEDFARHHIACTNRIGPYVFPSAGQDHVESSDSFSATDLGKVRELVEAIGELSWKLYLSASGPNENAAEEQYKLEIIGYSESQPELNTESFSGAPEAAGLSFYPLFDLGDLLQRLATYGSLLCRPEKALLAYELLEEAVVAHVHGDDFRLGEHPDAHGLTIYTPFRGSNYSPDYEGTRFAQDTTWDEFLREIPWTEE